MKRDETHRMAGETMDDTMKRLMRALEKNNMKPFYAATRAEVPPLVASLLQPGQTVTAGGSQSLFDAGVIQLLREGPYSFLDRTEAGLTEGDIADIYFEAMRADAYLCSCNALTLAGELYCVDGNANRVSAIAYGPKQVVMMVGRNKLVEDLDAAVDRVKSFVAPHICKLRGRRTPCAKTGRCVAPSGGAASMTAGCDSPERACCSYLVCGRQRIRDRIKVILVDEALGY